MPGYVVDALGKWNKQCARRSTSSNLPSRESVVALDAAVARWIAEDGLTETVTQVRARVAAEAQQNPTQAAA